MNAENDKEYKALENKVLAKNAKAKNQQQEKKEKLALALRDNLRRRKAAILPATKTDGED